MSADGGDGLQAYLAERRAEIEAALRRALAGKNFGSQDLAADRFAVGLGHRDSGGIQLRGGLKLSQRPRPLSLDAEKLDGHHYADMKAEWEAYAEANGIDY